MHLHILAFVSAFTLLTGLTFKRSSWGVSLYMLTIYMSPKAASWGDPIDSDSIRWTLIAALIYAVGVLLDQRKEGQQLQRRKSLLLPLLFLYGLNATAVHFAFAADPEISGRGLVELWKRTILVLLILASTKDRTDVRIMLATMVLGAGYVGREVIVNDSLCRDFDARTWVYMGVINGNHAAVLMSLSLPLGGYFLLTGSRWEKLVAALCLIYTLETVVRCNSRAVWLGLIAGSVWMVIRSGRYWKHVIGGLALGFSALLFTSDEADMGQIEERFASIFASADDREASAAQRVEFWKACLDLIADHPLGLGAEAAFNSDLGNTYIEHLHKNYGEKRSVHQGYLDTAASWGIQGFLIYMTALMTVVAAFLRPNPHATSEDRFLSVVLQVVLIIQLVTAFFGVNLASDSAYWILAISVASNSVVSASRPSSVLAPTPSVHSFKSVQVC